ncbi:MAG: cell division protein FtsL [Lachnospiraceae bacterium]|nr:cell division protein FtsL [Lachnospiraceae bacterium]
MQRDSRKNEYMYYTEGNAVRKVARPTYEAAPRHAEPERRQETHKRTYKNPNEGLTINVPYVMFLLVAACAVVISCMKYINLNSEINKVSDSIVSMENSVETLKAQNDAVEYEINSNVDIDAIIKTATEELGMVKISEDSIRFYTSTEGEYMKQFSDVPVE